MSLKHPKPAPQDVQRKLRHVKPCPFCGRHAVSLWVSEEDGTYPDGWMGMANRGRAPKQFFYVHCGGGWSYGCGAQGPIALTKRGAVRLWNRYGTEQADTKKPRLVTSTEPQ